MSWWAILCVRSASRSRVLLDCHSSRCDNPSMTHNMVTTAFTLDGYRITRNLGIVRGIVVRSRSIFGTIGAGLQTIIGGNITLLSELCEKTREQSFELMCQHADAMG